MKKLSINRKSLTLEQIIYIFFSIICIGIQYSICLISDEVVLFRCFGIVAVMHFAITVFLIKSHGFFSLSKIFVLLLYLFNFGQVILYGILDPNYRYVNSITQYPKEIYTKALMLAFMCISFTAVGIITNVDSQENIDYSNNNLDELNNYKSNLSKSIGIVILVISLPFQAYISFSNIMASKVVGYTNAFNGGFIFSIGSLAVIGFAMMIVSSRRYNFLFIIAACFYLVSMISGDRDMPVINLLLLLYVYSFRNIALFQKQKFRKIVVIIILVYAGFMFLESIEVMRSGGAFDINSFQSAFEKTANRGVIKSACYEFGSTIYTTSATIDYLNKTSGFGYGTTILFSPLAALPNFLININSFIEGNLNYGLILQKYGISGIWSNIGGSYVGELVYNFGYLSIVFAFVFGRIISSISNKLDSFLVNEDYYHASYYFGLYVGFVYWVRAYFYNGARVFVWSSIIIFILSQISAHRKH